MRAVNALPAVVEEHMGDLRALCEKYHVRRLALVGSAAKGTFDPQRSDLDFVVELEYASAHEHTDLFFGLQFALEKLFARNIDLIEMQAVRNPYLRTELEETQRDLYAA